MLYHHRAHIDGGVAKLRGPHAASDALARLEHGGRGSLAHVNLHPAVEREARAALGRKLVR